MRRPDRSEAGTHRGGLSREFYSEDLKNRTRCEVQGNLFGDNCFHLDRFTRQRGY
jgi:hypothetical protein